MVISWNEMDRLKSSFAVKILHGLFFCYKNVQVFCKFLMQTDWWMARSVSSLVANCAAIRKNLSLWFLLQVLCFWSRFSASSDKFRIFFPHQPPNRISWLAENCQTIASLYLADLGALNLSLQYCLRIYLLSLSPVIWSPCAVFCQGFPLRN